jgi:lambda family phage portal protein
VNILDRVIGFLSPEAGVRRAAARASLQQINQLIGTPNGPYAAANRHRLNARNRIVWRENDVDTSRAQSLRADSWQLYRDNPNARKVVRTIVAKTIGRHGMQPESLAMNADGTANIAFREKAQELWARIQSGFDLRGLPGKGGQTFAGLQKLALRNVILSGDILYRLQPISEQKQQAHDLPVPVALQLIDTCRLADESELVAEAVTEGNTVFRGVELTELGERVAYHIRVQPPYASANQTGAVKRFGIAEIGHLFIEDDIDQLRGLPWFAAALINMRDTSDLNYNVLKASAMAACIVGSYSKPTGATRVGLSQSATPVHTSADGSDLTDADGNTITKIQPAMLINTGKDGKFELHSPNQPNMNPEGFVQHLQRQTAGAMPGVKSSTITGDYRNSSFSSERSADNDAWPELHDVQEWFASSFCQPIYESLIRAAVLTGFFDGIISAAEFQANPGRFSAANWQGPVALSINPTDDAKAASLRIKGGLSSLQMECAKQNVNWRTVIDNIAEMQEVAAARGIPEVVVNNILGVDPQALTAMATIEQMEDVGSETADENEEETADV